MKWKSTDLPSKLYLTKGGNVSYYYRVFIILIVGIGISWQFSKQISKLSFQLSVQKYSLLGQREGERVQEGGNIVRLPPRVLGCYHKRWKSLSFCEIWNNPTLPLFFIRPLTNRHCWTWSSMINLWIDSRTSQK